MKKPPVYTGPEWIGKTHVAKLAKPVAGGAGLGVPRTLGENAVVAILATDDVPQDNDDARPVRTAL